MDRDQAPLAELALPDGQYARIQIDIIVVELERFGDAESRRKQ
jgi:hypothetical protein